MWGVYSLLRDTVDIAIGHQNKNVHFGQPLFF